MGAVRADSRRRRQSPHGTRVRQSCRSVGCLRHHPHVRHSPGGGSAAGQRAAGANRPPASGRAKRQPCSWAAGGPGSRPRRSRWAASSGRWPALHRGKGHRVEQQCAPAADENPGLEQRLVVASCRPSAARRTATHTGLLASAFAFAMPTRGMLFLDTPAKRFRLRKFLEWSESYSLESAVHASSCGPN